MLTINREDGIIMKKIGDDCMLIEEINLLNLSLFLIVQLHNVIFYYSLINHIFQDF